MCLSKEQGGRRCPSATGPASPAVYATRKSNRAYRRALANKVRAAGHDDLADLVMESPFTVMPELTHAAGLTPEQVSSSPLPGTIKNHPTTSPETEELIDSLNGVGESIYAAHASESANPVADAAEEFETTVTSLTPEQRKQRMEELAAEAEKLRDRAENADERGKFSLAKKLDDEADALEAQARALANADDTTQMESESRKGELSDDNIDNTEKDNRTRADAERVLSDDNREDDDTRNKAEDIALARASSTGAKSDDRYQSYLANIEDPRERRALAALVENGEFDNDLQQAAFQMNLDDEINDLVSFGEDIDDLVISYEEGLHDDDELEQMKRDGDFAGVADEHYRRAMLEAATRYKMNVDEVNEEFDDAAVTELDKFIYDGLKVVRTPDDIANADPIELLHSERELTAELTRARKEGVATDEEIAEIQGQLNAVLRARGGIDDMLRDDYASMTADELEKERMSLLIARDQSGHRPDIALDEIDEKLELLNDVRSKRRDVLFNGEAEISPDTAASDALDAYKELIGDNEAAFAHSDFDNVDEDTMAKIGSRFNDYRNTLDATSLAGTIEARDELANREALLAEQMNRTPHDEREGDEYNHLAAEYNAVSTLRQMTEDNLRERRRGLNSDGMETASVSDLIETAAAADFTSRRDFYSNDPASLARKQRSANARERLEELAAQRGDDEELVLETETGAPGYGPREVTVTDRSRYNLMAMESGDINMLFEDEQAHPAVRGAAVAELAARNLKNIESDDDRVAARAADQAIGDSSPAREAIARDLLREQVDNLEEGQTVAALDAERLPGMAGTDLYRLHHEDGDEWRQRSLIAATTEEYATNSDLIDRHNGLIERAARMENAAQDLQNFDIGNHAIKFGGEYYVGEEGRDELVAQLNRESDTLQEMAGIIRDRADADFPEEIDTRRAEFTDITHERANAYAEGALGHPRAPQLTDIDPKATRNMSLGEIRNYADALGATSGNEGFRGFSPQEYTNLEALGRAYTRHTGEVHPELQDAIDFTRGQHLAMTGGGGGNGLRNVSEVAKYLDDDEKTNNLFKGKSSVMPTDVEAVAEEIASDRGEAYYRRGEARRLRATARGIEATMRESMSGDQAVKTQELVDAMNTAADTLDKRADGSDRRASDTQANTLSYFEDENERQEARAKLESLAARTERKARQRSAYLSQGWGNQGRVVSGAVSPLGNSSPEERVASEVLTPSAIEVLTSESVPDTSETYEEARRKFTTARELKRNTDTMHPSHGLYVLGDDRGGDVSGEVATERADAAYQAAAEDLAGFENERWMERLKEDNNRLGDVTYDYQSHLSTLSNKLGKSVSRQSPEGFADYLEEAPSLRATNTNLDKARKARTPETFLNHLQSRAGDVDSIEETEFATSQLADTLVSRDPVLGARLTKGSQRLRDENPDLFGPNRDKVLDAIGGEWSYQGAAKDIYDYEVGGRSESDYEYTNALDPKVTRAMAMVSPTLFNKHRRERENAYEESFDEADRNRYRINVPEKDGDAAADAVAWGPVTSTYVPKPHANRVIEDLKKSNPNPSRADVKKALSTLSKDDVEQAINVQWARFDDTVSVLDPREDSLYREEVNDDNEVYFRRASAWRVSMKEEFDRLADEAKKDPSKLVELAEFSDRDSHVSGDVYIEDTPDREIAPRGMEPLFDL